MNDVETRLRALADADAPGLFGPGAPPPVEQLVHRIHRRRRRWAGAGAGSIAVLVALALSLGGGGGPTSLSTADEPTSTTEAGEQTSTTVAEVAPPLGTSTTSGPGATPTTKAAMVCRNSYDPACGPFRWDPRPGENAWVTVKTTITPTNPKVGETVTFTMVADDPDAVLEEASLTYGFGDNTPYTNTHPELGTGCPTVRTRYGPWTPPAKVHGHYVLTATHVYESAGSYMFAVLVNSARCDRFGPGAPRMENGQAVYNP